MRVAIYARYSSDAQSEASIDDQVRVCRARADREGWTIVGVYADYAISGATTDRAQFQALMASARLGKFDMVLAEAMDRISRDQEHIAGFYKHLTFAGIRTVTIAEGDISELHIGLKGTMSALFLKDLAQKTHRGLEGRVRQGRSAGGRAYGYRLVRELDSRGELVRGGRTIDPVEAAVINRIFTAFDGGASPRAIAKMLNQEGIPGPDDGVWQDTTIRGHALRSTGILRNQLYVGRLVWNRMRFIKDPTTGYRVSRPNPESAWVIEDVPDLRIVDQALWDRVDARLVGIRASDRSQKVQANAFWKQRRPKHLLSGKTYCGCCGGPMASIGKDYLACSTARNKGTCEHTRGVRRAAVEEVILDDLKSHLMHPDLVKEFSAAFIAETNRLRAGIEAGHAALEREQVQIDRKLAGLIDAIAEGLRSPGIKAQLEQLEARKIELEQKLVAPPAPLPRLHPNLAEVYRAKVADLHAALADPAGSNEAIEILRSLVERVIIRPTAEKGFELELVGELAAMLELGLNNKKPALGGAGVLGVYRSSVKVVAGTRNQRFLRLVEHKSRGW